MSLYVYSYPPPLFVDLLTAGICQCQQLKERCQTGFTIEHGKASWCRVTAVDRMNMAVNILRFKENKLNLSTSLTGLPLKI
jgi:hypothetical protein